MSFLIRLRVTKKNRPEDGYKRSMNFLDWAAENRDDILFHLYRILWGYVRSGADYSLGYTDYPEYNLVRNALFHASEIDIIKILDTALAETTTVEKRHSSLFAFVKVFGRDKIFKASDISGALNGDMIEGGPMDGTILPNRLAGGLFKSAKDEVLYNYKKQIIGLIKLECPKSKVEEVTPKAASIAFDNLSKKKIDPFYFEIIATNPKYFKFSVDESAIDQMEEQEKANMELVERMKKESRK